MTNPPILYVKYIPEGEFYIAEPEPFPGALRYDLHTESENEMNDLNEQREAYQKASGQNPIRSKPAPMQASSIIAALLIGLAAGLIAILPSIIGWFVK